jgi:Protein of unknown function (DUF3302)
MTRWCAANGPRWPSLTARGRRCAMASRLQGIGNSVDPLTFLVVSVLVIALASALYLLGNLPGRIANERRHPHAGAISICGWIGLLIIVLWPVALAWAYVTPKDHRRPIGGAEDFDALARDLDEAAKQIAAIKYTLAALSSSKR